MTKTMKNLTAFLVPLLGLAFATTGCNKDEPEAVDLGYGYFPRAVGTWIEYQVDSLWRVDELNIRDSTSYRLKEKVVEAYLDPAGRTAYRIHRFVLNAEDEWVIRDVWTSTADAYYAEVTEENRRLLKLSFPVRNGRKWDTNIYNTEDELEVAFRDEGQSWTGPTLVFPSTVVVKNTVPANFVNTDDYLERYAKDIGLVFRSREVAEVQSGEYSGWKWTMVAVAFGTE
jgi:hypothetical protein